MGKVIDEMAENGLSMIENVDPSFANDSKAFPEQVEDGFDENRNFDRRWRLSRAKCGDQGGGAAGDKHLW